MNECMNQTTEIGIEITFALIRILNRMTMYTFTYILEKFTYTRRQCCVDKKRKLHHTHLKYIQIIWKFQNRKYCESLFNLITASKKVNLFIKIHQNINWLIVYFFKSLIYI